MSTPMRGIKPLPKSPGRLRFLDSGEIAILLGACDIHLAPLVTVALHNGLRLSEVGCLSWDAVNLTSGMPCVVLGKGGKSRDIPLSDTARETLRKQPKRLDSPLVFPSPLTNGEWDFRGRFKRTVKRTGLTEVTFHTLRHTFASHLVMSGVDLVTVKELMGHSNIAMTMRYAHLSSNHKVAAVKQLDTSMGHQPFSGETDTSITNG